MQHTLKTAVTLSGIGLHSGHDITLTLRPARAGNGIVFLRTDLTGQDNVIPALWNAVVDTKLCTVIANDSGARVGTIEHVMAALRGCGIDNAVVEVSGPEVPVMDGSAQPFVDLIERAGKQPQDLPRRAIKILKDITVELEGKTATLRPDEESVFSGAIDFDHPEIGQQAYETKLVNGNFVHELANSRTFGFMHEVEYLQANGLALGGSLDNAIVLDRDTVMNASGLRHDDEFIRHKLLDAIGDLYLAGGPIIGAYEGYKAGHALNNMVLQALFADDQAWEYVDVYGEDTPVRHSVSVSSPDYTSAYV